MLEKNTIKKNKISHRWELNQSQNAQQYTPVFCHQGTPSVLLINDGGTHLIVGLTIYFMCLSLSKLHPPFIIPNGDDLNPKIGESQHYKALCTSPGTALFLYLNRKCRRNAISLYKSLTLSLFVKVMSFSRASQVTLTEFLDMEHQETSVDIRKSLIRIKRKLKQKK